MSGWRAAVAAVIITERTDLPGARESVVTVESCYIMALRRNNKGGG